MYAVNALESTNSVRLFASAENENYNELVKLDEKGISGHETNESQTRILYYTHDDKLFVYDFENEIIETLEIPESGENSDSRIIDAYFINDSHIMCEYGNYGDGYDYLIYDLNGSEKLIGKAHSEKKTVFSAKDLNALINGEMSASELNPVSITAYFGEINREDCSKDLKQIVVKKADVYYSFNTETMVDSYPVLPAIGSTTTHKVYYSEVNDNYAICEEKSMGVFSGDGDTIAAFYLSDGELEVQNVCLTDDAVYFVCKDGFLYKGTFDGNITQVVSLYESNSNSSSQVKSISFVEKYGYLMVVLSNDTKVVDLDAGKVRFSIEEEAEYNAFLDRFIVYYYKEIGTYPVYPVGTIYEDIRNDV